MKFVYNRNVKRILPILFIPLFLIAFPKTIFATSIIINEIFANPDGPSSEDSEWIEIYNTTDVSMDISEWKLDDIDGGGSNPYTFPSGTIISAKGFLAFDKSITNIALNNDNDTVRISSASGELIDSYTYNDTKETQSWGRKQDGGSEWVWFSTPSKNTSNATGIVVPTSTQAPTATTEPSKTPTPTKNPTPTLSPTKAVSPTNTLIPTKKVIPTPTIKQSSLKVTPKNLQILGEKTSTYDYIPTINPTQSVQTAGASNMSFGTLLIAAGGVFLIVCGILAYYTYKKNKVL